MAIQTCRDDVARKRRLSIARASDRLRAALRLMHRGITAAKTRRLQNELMCHAGDDDEQSADQTIAKFPQRPLILGDKWDF